MYSSYLIVKESSIVLLSCDIESGIHELSHHELSHHELSHHELSHHELSHHVHLLHVSDMFICETRSNIIAHTPLMRRCSITCCVSIHHVILHE